MICRMTKQQRSILNEFIAAQCNLATMTTYSIIADHLNSTHDSPKAILDATARLSKAKKEFERIFANENDFSDNLIIEEEHRAG